MKYKEQSLDLNCLYDVGEGEGLTPAGNASDLDTLHAKSTIEYVADLLADRDITADEKQETIQGIFELHLGLLPSCSAADGPGTDE